MKSGESQDSIINDLQNEVEIEAATKRRGMSNGGGSSRVVDLPAGGSRAGRPTILAINAGQNLALPAAAGTAGSRSPPRL